MDFYPLHLKKSYLDKTNIIEDLKGFLLYKDKHAILLALTSNQGSADFQFSENNEKSLFKVRSFAINPESSI